MAMQADTGRTGRLGRVAVGLAAAAIVVWAAAASLAPGQAAANDLNRVVNALISVPDDEQRRVLSSIATAVRTLRTYDAADLQEPDAVSFVDFLFIAAPGAIAGGRIDPAAVQVLAPSLQAHVLAQSAQNPACFVTRVRDERGRPISVGVFNITAQQPPELIHQCFTLALWNHLKGSTEGANAADWRGMILQLMTERRPGT